MTNDTLVKKLFSFPNPVNEYSARMVGFGAFCLSVAYVLTGNIWVLVVLTYGFWARVLTGPTLSPWVSLLPEFLRLYSQNREA